MVKQKETDEFLTNKKHSSSLNSRKCYQKWWHQDFKHQQRICKIVESNYFRVLIIFLVIVDTGLLITEIMLDSYKIHDKCQTNHHKKHDISEERIELIMEIAHYLSIAILSFFVIELIVRIYASGKEFWNISRKKMEYFDAFVVITSLIADLYFLHPDNKREGRQLIILFSFRLWRFVRIISSVSEGILQAETKHKRELSKKYTNAIHRLVELLKHKTSYLGDNSQNNENLTNIIEHFQLLDERCQTSLDEMDQNKELSLTVIITQFIEDLQGLENRTKDSIIPQIMIKPHKI